MRLVYVCVCANIDEKVDPRIVLKPENDSLPIDGKVDADGIYGRCALLKVLSLQIPVGGVYYCYVHSHQYFMLCK